MSTHNPEQARWFTEEVQPCEAPLRSYLRQALPSPADVDDTVQDCFVRVLKAKERGGVRETKPFVFAVARNLVRDFFSRRHRREFVSIAEEAELPVLVDEAGVVESICHDQELALLAEAIDALPQRCREVMLLRKIKGIPQKEIAQLLGISEHTVEVQTGKGTRFCVDYLRARGIGKGLR